MSRTNQPERTMNQCNEPDHGAINAERAESRGLRKAWVELDDKRQDLEKQLSAITEQRDRLAGALDMLDEVIKKMRPRYMGHPTMDGRFPCWTVWMPHTGTTERKSLKEAVLEYLAAVEGGKP